jgi:hypothetical protein
MDEVIDVVEGPNKKAWCAWSEVGDLKQAGKKDTTLVAREEVLTERQAAALASLFDSLEYAVTPLNLDEPRRSKTNSASATPLALCDQDKPQTEAGPVRDAARVSPWRTCECIPCARLLPPLPRRRSR